MTKKCFFVLNVLLMFVSCSYAQKLENISIVATTEAIAFPFSSYFPLHPGIELKGTFRKIEKPNSIRYLNANMGLFYHRKIETGIYFGGEYQYSHYLFNGKITLDLPLGIGYFHSIYPSEVYRQTNNGDFEKFNPIGRPSGYMNTGIGLTYLSNGNIHPFVRQELLLELPLFLHSFFKIGIQIKLKEND